MADAETLWRKVLDLDETDEDAAAGVLRELAVLPGADAVIGSSIEAGRRRRALQVLGQAAAGELALRLLPVLVRMASTAHPDLIAVRKVLRRLPRDELATRIWPLARQCIVPGDWEAPRRLAELFVELRLREPLERMLGLVATSDDVDWREVAKDFAGVWETPRWGTPVQDWQRR